MSNYENEYQAQYRLTNEALEASGKTEYVTERASLIAVAQIHATLAVAAATMSLIYARSGRRGHFRL